MQVGLQLAHREVLEDAVLDLLEVVVVAVEDLARVGDVEVVVARDRPRQRDDPVEIGADDGVLGALRRDLRRAGRARAAPPCRSPRAAPSLSSCSRSSSISACDSSVSPSSCWIAFICWRRKYSRCDLSISLRTSLWIFEPSSRTSSSWARIPMSLRRRCSTFDSSSRACLSSVLMRIVEATRKASGPGLFDVGGRHLELLGQVGHEGDDLRERAQQAGAQGVDLLALDGDVLDLGDVGDEVRLFLHVAVDVHALQSLDEDAHGAVGQLDHLVGETDGPDVVQQLGAGRLDLGVLGRDERQQAVAGEDVVDQADRAFLADRQRDHRVREHDRVAQRQHRQRAGDLLLRVGDLGLFHGAHASSSVVVIWILRSRRVAVDEREAHLEDAGLVGRRRAVGVDVDHQAHATLEGPVVHLDLLVDAALAAREATLAADDDLAPLDEELDVVALHARELEAHDDLRASAPGRTRRPWA